MDCVVYDIKALEKARKKAQRRESFQRKTNEIECWIANHKEIIAVVVPVGLGAAGVITKGVRAIGRNRKMKKEQDLKELYCYDRSLGHYWKLRRELTNSEWVEIDKRKKRGERLADILNEMKVLK